MNLLIKNTLRSLREKKGQIFVIIFTIIIITAMFFISLSMYDIFYNIHMPEYDRIANGADMLVGSHTDSKELYSKARLDKLLDKNDIKDIKYFTKFASVLKTQTDTKTVLVEATDLKSYLEKNPIEFVKSYNPKLAIDSDYWFEGQKNLKLIDPKDFAQGDTLAGYPLVIVDIEFAKKANVDVGEIVEVFIPTFSSYTKMKIGYIAVKKDIFSSPASKNILVDSSSIENVGQLTATYISFKDKSSYNKYKDIIQKEFPSVEITEGNSYTYVMSMIKNNTLLLSVALVSLAATMMLILYSTYAIISKNRTKDMITFKSIGATPKQASLILLIEVIVYVLIGVAIGLIFGRFLFTLVVRILMPQALNAISFPIWKYLVAAITSLLITILSTIGPIYSISKKTITDLKQDNIKVARLHKPIIIIICSILLLALTLIYFVVKNTIVRMIAAYLLIPFTIILVILLSGYLFNWIAKGLRKTKLSLSSYASTRNSSVKGLATMLALVITFSFFVVQLVDLVKVAVVPFNSRYHASYVISAQKPIDNSDFETFNNQVILKVKGVDSSTYYNEVLFIYPGNKDPVKSDMAIYGISDKKHLKISTKNLDPQTYQRWDEVSNPLVLSNDVMLRLNLKIGDKISLSPFSLDYRSTPLSFTIVGVDYMLSQWDQIGYAKYSQLEKMSQPVVFMIQSNEDVFLNLREAIETSDLKQSYALKFDEWAYIDRDMSVSITYLLAFVQTLIYIVAIIGILNMAIMTSYSRQNELDIYKVSGMSDGDFFKFSLGEGLLIAASGGLLGVLSSFLINLAVPVFNNIINKYVKLRIFPYEIIVVFLVSISLFLVVWMFISIFNKKRSISSFNKRFNE